MSTLRDIASLAAGTEVIFQYEVLDSLLDAEGQRLTATLKAMGVARGEPWLSFFDPTSLRARVRELGFAAVWDVGPRKPTRDILRGVRMGYVLSPYLISWKPRLEALLNQREPRATPNKAVLVTAARLRFGLTLKGHIWAAARDGERSPFASLRENAALSGSCLPSAPLREN